jgi:PiT family inorganic phosphate transporter
LNFPPLFILISLNILFDFLNGMRDSGNFVSTLISTHAMSQRRSLLVTAFAEFCGPLIFGTAVAGAFGRGLVTPGVLSQKVLIAALAGAIIWNFFTLVISIPSSSTHALLGGILGAVIFASGVGVIQVQGLLKILVSLVLSPTLGILGGYIILRLIYFLAQNASPKINQTFNRLQVTSAILLALTYGANDAQKTMAVTTLGLIAAGKLTEFNVPLWVMLLSAGTISAGILFGGQRMVRTLGSKFYRIRPVHGASAQMTSAIVVIFASIFGYPVSSSQVVTSAILGAGSADRINKVRWGVAGQIVEAWFLAVPVCAGLSAGIYWLLSL